MTREYSINPDRLFLRQLKASRAIKKKAGKANGDIRFSPPLTAVKRDGNLIIIAGGQGDCRIATSVLTIAELEILIPFLEESTKGTGTTPVSSPIEMKRPPNHSQKILPVGQKETPPTSAIQDMQYVCRYVDIFQKEFQNQREFFLGMHEILVDIRNHLAVKNPPLLQKDLQEQREILKGILAAVIDVRELVKTMPVPQGEAATISTPSVPHTGAIQVPDTVSQHLASIASDMHLHCRILEKKNAVPGMRM